MAAFVALHAEFEPRVDQRAEGLRQHHRQPAVDQPRYARFTTAEHAVARCVRGIERHGPRQAIVRGIARTCNDLGIDIIAEGIETEEEYFWFLDEGITLFQGPLLAPPSLGTLLTAFKLPK